MSDKEIDVSNLPSLHVTEVAAKITYLIKLGCGVLRVKPM